MTFYTNVGGRRNGYVPGRDRNVDEVMRGWENRYCIFSDASIFISTFNVNGRSPPRHLKGWFPADSMADFYVVGLQEMDLSVGTYIIDNTKKMEEWLDTIKASLPGGARQYSVVETERLVGIFLVLLQSTSSKVKLRDLEKGTVATGISLLGNKLGNKGGTAISLRMNDSRVCFINCHLAAGNNELERRNQDFREISQIQFPSGLSIYEHDVVFWFGDLNYRINSDEKWSGEVVRQIASSTEFRGLFKYDQLREQQSLGRVFENFVETPVPGFRPTYKYDTGTSDWDSSEKARVPAWCDRILWWKINDGIKLSQLLYDSVESITISDHKPVRSSFRLILKSIDQRKADALHEEAIREADRRANELLPQIKLSETEIDFGEIHYFQPYVHQITVENVGKSSVHFKFMKRPQSGVSANWLQVTPPHYSIPVGQSTQLSFTITITKEVAFDLEETHLQDILVMSLENGRDHFIPVTAKYYPRCFGVTIERLLTNKHQSDNLIDLGDAVDATDLSPPNVPREIYRLVTALQLRGTENLILSETAVPLSTFITIRNALEMDTPKDFNPIVPFDRQEEVKQACRDSGRLWALVGSFPLINAAVFEYIINYLTDVVRNKRNADDLLTEWADALFRDRKPLPPHLCQSPLSTDPRAIALRNLCAYSRDVSIFHANSAPRLT